MQISRELEGSISNPRVQNSPATDSAYLQSGNSVEKRLPIGEAVMKRLFLTGVAALFLATGMVTSALADERCDTLHTSDARGQWRCGTVCVRQYGNNGDRSFQIGQDHKSGRSGVTDDMTFVIQGGRGIRPSTVMMNGKRCKYLEQTYDYEKSK
jgi:hypothetical protein